METSQQRAEEFVQEGNENEEGGNLPEQVWIETVHFVNCHFVFSRRAEVTPFLKGQSAGFTGAPRLVVGCCLALIASLIPVKMQQRKREQTIGRQDNCCHGMVCVWRFEFLSLVVLL